MAEIGFLVIAGLARLVRQRGLGMPVDRTVGLAHPLARLGGVLNVGFTLGLSAMVRSLADTNRLVLRFNVPAEFSPLFVIPVVTAALTLGLMIVAGWVWARGRQSALRRVLLSPVTLAAVVLSGLMASWDLLTLLF